MRIRLTLLAALVAAVVLVPGATATATATHTAELKGVELAATSTRGTFAGTASGELSGAWAATVDHTPLGSTTGATITGGSFSITTRLDGWPTLLRGRFAGGTVSVIDPGTGCQNQRFGIAGDLADVGAWSAGTGVGSFDGVLVHYRARVFGNCVTYAATVTGAVSLLF